MQSRDYYFASIYILAYLTAVKILDFLFSLLSFDLNYVGFDGTIDFTVIGSTIFFMLLSMFALYQIFKKTMLGFYSGITLYSLAIIAVIGSLLVYFMHLSPSCL